MTCCAEKSGDGRYCLAVKQGDCSVHPLMCRMFFNMEHIEGYWGELQWRWEHSIAASMTEEEKIAAQRKKEAEEAEALERAARAEAEREKRIEEARAQKAVADAKENARRRLASGKAVTGECTWVKLQKEAQRLLAEGCSEDTILSEKFLTPGRMRISVKEALPGCHAAKKHTCEFCPGFDPSAVGFKKRQGGSHNAHNGGYRR